jgi:hypothetical protein
VTTVIGYEESEQLDVEPAKYFVLVTKREKRACKRCEERGLMAAPLPDRILEKSLWSAMRAEATSCGLSFVASTKRRSRDPVLTAQIRRLHPSFALLQYPNDLLFTESALLHASVLSSNLRENSSFNR